MAQPTEHVGSEQPIACSLCSRFQIFSWISALVGAGGPEPELGPGLGPGPDLWHERAAGAARNSSFVHFREVQLLLGRGPGLGRLGQRLGRPEKLRKFENLKKNQINPKIAGNDL